MLVAVVEGILRAAGEKAGGSAIAQQAAVKLAA
jgi:hypothetical protein